MVPIQSSGIAGSVGASFIVVPAHATTIAATNKRMDVRSCATIQNNAVDLMAYDLEQCEYLQYQPLRPTTDDGLALDEGQPVPDAVDAHNAQMWAMKAINACLAEPH